MNTKMSVNETLKDFKCPACGNKEFSIIRTDNILVRINEKGFAESDGVSDSSYECYCSDCGDGIMFTHGFLHKVYNLMGKGE